MRREIPTLPSVRLPRILAVLFAALLACCADNRLSDGGSSSGVDNPSLTVGFVDASGTAVRVSGDLDIYAADQNPAVDPEPLATIRIKNSAFTNLKGSDFERLMSPAAGKQVLNSPGKTSAVPPAGPPNPADSAVTSFNIVLRTQDRTGSLALGFKYDSVAKAFTREGAGESAKEGPKEDARVGEGAPLKRFDLQPKPLVRYAAKVSREPVHGKDGRVFVPGSPFQATLVDNLFVLEGVPEGLFPLRLLAADGKVYPVSDSLNTLDSTLVYRPKPTPVGKIDTAGPDSVPSFTVDAGEPRQALLDFNTVLEGILIGASASDARLSVVWRLIKQSPDSLPRDTAPGPPGPPGPPPPKPDSGKRKAEILKPTSLRTEVRFGAEGYYEFELRATIGLRSHADTVSISVARQPDPVPRIVTPLPGDTLRAGGSYSVQWVLPDSGPVVITVSLDSGGTWLDLVRGYASKDKLPIYPWTPARELGSSDHCLLRVRSQADSTLQADMMATFRLAP